MNHTRPLQLLALKVLSDAFNAAMAGREQKDISVQGMGMLRFYIADIGRLHIWDSRLRYPGVSMVHNHSWDLRSTVIVGSLVNTIYSEETIPAEFWVPYMKRRLVTGFNCDFVDDATEVKLWKRSERIYQAGEIYAQQANEIHRTDAQDATVTIMERQEDVQGEADVYWPVSEQWGTARPRPATMAEIAMVTSSAMGVLDQHLRANPNLAVLG